LSLRAVNSQLSRSFVFFILLHYDKEGVSYARDF